MRVATILVTALMLLAAPAGGGAQQARAATDTAGGARPPALVIFMGGFMDGTFGGFVAYAQTWTPPAPNVARRYYGWGDTLRARDEVKAFLATHPEGGVALVGHSFGGHGVVKVARMLAEEGDGIAIPLVITLDPITQPMERARSPGGGGGGSGDRAPRGTELGAPPARPRSVGYWLNVRPGGPRTSSACDRIAAVGEWLTVPWRDPSGADRSIAAGGDHCAFEELFETQPCVTRLLLALADGARTGLSCDQDAAGRPDRRRR